MLIFVSKQSILTCFVFKNFLQNHFFQFLFDSLAPTLGWEKSCRIICSLSEGFSKTETFQRIALYFWISFIPHISFTVAGV
jgi:hypothetical protein